MLKPQADSQTMTERTRSPVAAPRVSSGGANTAISDDVQQKPPISIEAWDRVGKLTRSFTRKMMQNQASMVSKRFRQGNSPLTVCQPPIKKRRQTSHDDDDDANEQQTQDNATPISDDETSGNEDRVNAEPLPSFISEQVDRMARMSKYIMEIEYCHRMLREEIKAMETSSL